MIDSRHERVGSKGLVSLSFWRKVKTKKEHTLQRNREERKSRGSQDKLGKLTRQDKMDEKKQQVHASWFWV